MPKIPTFKPPTIPTLRARRVIREFKPFRELGDGQPAPRAPRFGLRRPVPPGRMDYVRTPEWRALRRRMLREAAFTCRACGVHKPNGKGLVVDHIIEVADGGAVLDEVNLQVLCRSCHAVKTEHVRNARRARQRKAAAQANPKPRRAPRPPRRRY